MLNETILKVEDVVVPGDEIRPAESGLRNNFRFRLINDFLTFEKEVFVREGSNAKNYPVFYTAMQPCFLIEARLRHEVNGGSGATVDVEKLSNGVLKGSGGTMLSSKFNIATGAGTVQSRGASIVLSGFQLLPGDSIALKATGTLTSASNIVVGVLFGMNAKNMPIGQSASSVLVGGV